MKRIFTFFFLLMAAHSFTAKAQININDSLALVDFYNSTNGPTWVGHTNWLTANPVSTWYGIVTTDNRVVQIQIPYNNLTGSLPTTIGNLTNLTLLALANNHIGGAIPASITLLSNLQDLFMPGNNFSGSLPADIGNMAQLDDLTLGDNNLSGAIPASVTNSKNLTGIDLSGNKFEGTINPEFFNNPKLVGLDLSKNKFTGTIPDNIGNATALIYLFLDHNHLKGKVPESIGKLVNLANCHLEHNDFTGKIPYSIGKLVNLNYLYLQHNNFKGTVPGSFKYLQKLYYLDVSYNNLTQPGNKNFPIAPKTYTRFTLSYNRFTFNGLEFVAKEILHPVYSPQANVTIHQSGKMLSVYAGGTLSNNTYKWFKVAGSSTTISGDSTYSPTTSGMYYVTVTNAIATKLTLYSDTIDFTDENTIAGNYLTANANNKNLEQGLQAYPNPARDVVHIQVKGSANIILTNSDGKTLLTKKINNSSGINVSKLAAGTYYIQDKNTGETQKILVNH